MKQYLPYAFLFAILIFTVLTRFYGLGKIPVGPDWDEAAIGYNAYSVRNTGKDEFGFAFPLVFRSFNDYKPPLYIYLTIPSVALFGLHTWSVRLPSALMGILAVAGTYFLTRELLQFMCIREGSSSRNQHSLLKFQQDFERNTYRSSYLKYVPIISSALLAISPWHIQFSRVAFEASVGVAFNIWGTIFFLRGLRSSKYFYLSSILFALGMYTYHTERLFVPLYILLLGTVFKNYIIQYRKELLVSVCICLAMTVPIMVSLFDTSGLERFSSTSIFRKQTEFLEKSVQKYNWDKEHGSFVGQFLNDRRFEWAKIFISGYISHFSPRWLFATGDYPRHHAPDSGLLYLWTIPFLCIGLIVIFGEFKILQRYLYGWLLISPLASAFTYEAPHAVRTLVFLPAFEIIVSVGIWKSLSYIRFQLQTNSDMVRKVMIISIVISLSLFSIFEIVRYFDLYFVHMNAEYSEYWQSGYEEAVGYVKTNGNKYSKVIVSSNLEQPYIFFLFYLQYDPEKYLSEGGTFAKGEDGVLHAFDKYQFRPIDWAKEKRDGKTLFIVTPRESIGNPKKVIHYLDGTPSIAILE